MKELLPLQSSSSFAETECNSSSQVVLPLWQRECPAQRWTDASNPAGESSGFTW